MESPILICRTKEQIKSNPVDVSKTQDGVSHLVNTNVQISRLYVVNIIESSQRPLLQKQDETIEQNSEIFKQKMEENKQMIQAKKLKKELLKGEKGEQNSQPGIPNSFRPTGVSAQESRGK